MAFTIRYCGSCGYRQRAQRLAAELDVQVDEASKLLVSSGGIFEVEYKGQLIYSKKNNGRFPEDGEIARILYGLEQGLSLAEAQTEAAKNIPSPPAFADWLASWVKNRNQLTP